MTRQVVALTGLSGVGKSTLITSLSASVPLQHLQASVLINEGRNASRDASLTQDQLRLADIEENQKLLIRGFKCNAHTSAGLVILDSHTVIERDDGLTRIDPRVFGAIGIDSMIFLADDPAAIAQRRRDDTARRRPLTTPEGLQRIQEEAQCHAAAICRALAIALHIFRPDQFALIVQMLQQRRISRE